MNAQMLESIDDSNLDDVAGGLSLGLALDSKLIKANVFASTRQRRHQRGRFGQRAWHLCEPGRGRQHRLSRLASAHGGSGFSPGPVALWEARSRARAGELWSAAHFRVTG